MDENVQTCDVFILFNGPLRSFKHGVLYSTANDPQPQMIPRPQMIPKMDRK